MELNGVGRHDQELTPNNLREYFDLDSSCFAQNRWFGSAVAKKDYETTRRYLLEFLRVSNQDDVLEIGCGPGVWTDHVSGLCRRITAIDISGKMLMLAKTRAVGDNVTFKQANFDEFEDSQTYDRIFSVRAIEYSPDIERTVMKMHAMTREGGTTTTITKTWPTLITVRARLWQWLRRILLQARGPSLEVLMKRISPSKLAKLFLRSGYRKVDIYPVVLRVPLFVHGRYPLPWAREALQHRYEMAMLRFCDHIAQRALSASTFVRKLLLPFSETYLIIATK
ncbi:MAG: class I SAM-dependent methyltransferase [Phycisphaerales bacterium]|nr:MAG: class I SAM-dependent methyltransferase [Phycisphaerales bacterium]